MWRVKVNQSVSEWMSLVVFSTFRYCVRLCCLRECALGDTRIFLLPQDLSMQLLNESSQ